MGLEQDGRSMSSARVVFLQQVRGCNWGGDRSTPAGDKPGRDDGRHDDQAYLAVTVIAHPVLMDEVCRVCLRNVQFQLTGACR
jgi:hypothetical protein